MAGLLVWGVVARLDSPPRGAPDAAPPPILAPASPSVARDIAPLYASSQLDGHWLSTPLTSRSGGVHPGERLTMLIRGTALVVWAGTLAEPEQRIVAYDAVYVAGHRLELRPVGVSGQVGHYHWVLSDDELRLRPLPGTDRPGHRHLVTQAFSRA